MAAGMPPAQALATNKLQACGGSLSATLYFVRRKVVNLADQKLNILMTFIGSTAGALLVQHVQSDILKQILPLLVIGIGLYFLLMPKLGEADRQRRLYGLPFALVAGGSVGFYDGFFGPGAGSFYALAFVTLAGFNGEVDGPRQTAQRHLERRRPAAVYYRREGYLGYRLCDDGRTVYWRPRRLPTGAE